MIEDRGAGGEAVSTRSGLTGQAHLSNRGDEDAEVGHAQIWGREAAVNLARMSSVTRGRLRLRER